MVEANLKILSNLVPEATTSMQRDVLAGKNSEIDGLVYEVVRMGAEYGVPVPVYTKSGGETAWDKNKIYCIFYMGTAQSLKTMTERFLFHQ